MLYTPPKSLVFRDMPDPVGTNLETVFALGFLSGYTDTLNNKRLFQKSLFIGDNIYHFDFCELVRVTADTTFAPVAFPVHPGFFNTCTSSRKSLTLTRYFF